MAEFTKGPWRRMLDDTVYGLPGKLCIWTSAGAGHGLIAQVVVGPIPEAEAIANARLIASSPELYAICEEILPFVSRQKSVLGGPNWEMFAERITEALAKARGEAR